MSLHTFVRQHITKKGALGVYKETLQRFLSDAVLTDEEKVELEKLAEDLDLTNEDLHRINAAVTSGVLQEISDDRRITEDEKDSLEELIVHFGLSTEDINFNQKSFNKFYTLALLEQGILPHITARYRELPLVLKDDEVLHYAGGAVLRSHAKLPVEKKHIGLEGSISLSKGVHYRIGSAHTVIPAKHVLAASDKGAFYLTSRQVGFMGPKKQFALPYRDVRSFELRPQGLTIYKDGRENPYIVTLDDYEVPFTLASFLIQ